MLMVEKSFFNGVTMNYIGKRAYVSNNSHRRWVVFAFDKNLHQGSIWNEHRSVLSFTIHKSISLHFSHHDTKFYGRYIDCDYITYIY